MKARVCLWAMGMIALGLGAGAQARDLTFEDRVKAQEAIEEVYWAHRIWPKENPGPKPPLSAVMPHEAIRAKVEDYLKKSNALGSVWKRPITSEQLQSEMDRMSRDSHAPQVLNELFAALGKDPFVIAESLARQTLVDGLIRNAYTNDRNLKKEAEAARWPSVSFDDWWSVERGVVGTRVEGSRGRFTLVAPVVTTCVNDTWVPTSTGAGVPTARLGHTSVWTGSEMIVWGGQPQTNLAGPYGQPSTSLTETYQSGGRYDPATDSWRVTSEGSGAPVSRSFHSAVWTGVEMIVWGGSSDPNSYENSGGRYNPATDSWTATSLGANVPAGRGVPSALWTGTEMIVWGGFAAGGRNDGARYVAATDMWIPISGSGAPAPRHQHVTVWTGHEMIVWGGFAPFPLSWTNTGGVYDPATDHWRPTSTAIGVPAGRSASTAVWTGRVMVVWGGYAQATGAFSSGGRYDPVADSWSSTSQGPNLPTGRQFHTAVWTGQEMVVWGGTTTNGAIFTNTGGRYNPESNTWASTDAGPMAPEKRDLHTAVWTGQEMIVWGGGRFTGVNTGGRYCAASSCAVSTWYYDADGDGFGLAGNAVLSCTQPPGYLAQDGDCDDADPFVHPGISETCNGIDDDCNGVIDDSGAMLCDDLNSCTDDFCHGVENCVNMPNSVSCDDGNACTIADACAAGVCESGRVIVPKVDCNDHNLCTADTCDPEFGCFHAPIFCNDHDRNTIDSCDRRRGCVFTPRQGVPLSAPIDLQSELN